VLTIVNLLIFGSSFSIIILAFGLFSEKKNRAEIIIGFAFYLLWGVDALLVLSEVTCFYQKYPHLLYLNQPFEFFIGTIVYYFYRIKIEGKMKFDLLSAALFTPGILAVLCFIPFFILNADAKLASVGFVNIRNGVIRNIYLFIMYAAGPWIIFCLGLSVFHGYKMLSKKNIDLLLHKKVFISYNIFWIVIIFGFYLTNLYHNRIFFELLLFFINCMVIFFYYLERKHSDFIRLMQKYASETRYVKSRIRGIDTRSVIRRIKELMEQENIYLDEEMSLTKLSSILNITPYQLSEILNDSFNTNFKSFINIYRVSAATEMLLEQEDTGIIHIAYQCGFNSKSVFNTAFSKIIGMTPTDFREKYKKKNPQS
jgi:AraC-like DNA-binding protein